MPSPGIAAALCIALVCLTQTVAGDQATATSTTNQAVSARANLDFVINVGKFVFLRVGTGAYPTASGTIDTVNFALTPNIPAAAVTPVNGNSVAVTWNGVAPGTTVAATNATLPVEVRSNAGAISLTATVTQALTSGANSIPLSQITITSSDPANLPAPLVPNSGVSAAVSVTGSSAGSLITQRAANWTFGFNNVTTPVVGNYSGQLLFTATSF